MVRVDDEHSIEQRNPVALYWKLKDNELAEVGSEAFPHVLSTYRLTEHHLSGTMSRWLPWLTELMPELFCEISPEHAAELGVGNTDWIRISTPRGSIRAKALVTRRIRPFHLKGGKVVHHVGLPWHWGYKGIATGDVVNNLTALVGGGLLLMGIGVGSLLELRPVRVANYLPALAIAPLIVAVLHGFGVAGY